MINLMLLVLTAWISIAGTFAYGADECTAAAEATQTHPPLYAQSSCCTLHQGACGCRGSRVICCDGTLSGNCGCLRTDEDEEHNSKEVVMPPIDGSVFEELTAVRE